MPKLDINTDLIRELARLLEETGLSEIEVGDGTQRIRVARATGQRAEIAVSPSPAETPAASAAGAGAAAEEAPAVQERPVDGNHPGAVTSPMVGTIYLGPEPGATPFVTVGDSVSEGQTLFIVEAMKTMNPIRAPRGGKITHIFVENGAPVEYGEVLLLLQ